MQRYLDEVYKYTSIGRPLDPTYPTNLAIMLLTPLGGALAGLLALLNGSDLGQAAQAGFFAAAALFLGWVLAREIDPDRELSAFVAAGFAFGATLFAPMPPQLIALAALLILTRIVNRIVGLPARITDSIPALLLTLAAIFVSDQWVFGLAAVVAFALDAVLVRPLRLQWVFAGLALLGTVVYVGTNGAGAIGTFTLPLLLAALVIAAGYVVNIVTTRRLTTPCDATGDPVYTVRVQAAMMVTLLAAVNSLWYGDAGIWGMLPVWATLAALTLYRMLPVPDFKFQRMSRARAEQ